MTKPALYINVYELPAVSQNFNRCTSCLGFGTYHTAVQVGKTEYAFGGSSGLPMTGIYKTAPRKNHRFVFKY